MYYQADYSSPLGTVTLASDGVSLVGLWIEGQKYHGGTVTEAMVRDDDLQVFKDVKNWLGKYFAGHKPSISDLPLAPLGGEFRKAVWNVLCEIPYGEYITYKDIAEILAEKMDKESMSCQAVGGAVGHNPISIIIPCHRVVGSNGSLTGYAGGIDKKVKLLEHEGADMSKLFMPVRGSAL